MKNPALPPRATALLATLPSLLLHLHLPQPSHAFSSASPPPPPPAAPVAVHVVDGVPCRELAIHVASLDRDVTILEATSEGQEALVDAVLADEEDEDGEGGSGGDGGRLVREDPYGAVLWPAASAVAEHLASDAFWNADDDGRRNGPRRRPALLELGTGTGLVALAASASRAFSSVLATDYEAVPLKLLDAADGLNRRRDGAAANPTTVAHATPMTPINTSLFDICDFDTPLPPGDVVCAADVLYEPRTGIALAKRTIEALNRGSRVVVGCSPGRPGRPKFLEELKRLRPGIRGAEFREVEGTTCTGRRHELICGEGSTSVSDEPKMLMVALMDLRPECLG